MATFDFTANMRNGVGRSQTSRRVEFHITVDFAKMGDGTGLAAGETAKIGTLPAGYVHGRLDAILRKAEGEAATVDVGTEADPDGFLDGGNMNGAINARVAPAGTEAFGAGTYHHGNTDIVVMTPALAATLDVGKIDLTFVGYLRDTGNER
jgi:hypothetical protein